MPEIHLDYACGCRDTWQVPGLLNGEDPIMRSEGICLPEHCDSCTAHGHACPTRLDVQNVANYPLDPITWSEDGLKRRYTRRKATP